MIACHPEPGTLGIAFIGVLCLVLRTMVYGDGYYQSLTENSFHSSKMFKILDFQELKCEIMTFQNLLKIHRLKIKKIIMKNQW